MHKHFHLIIWLFQPFWQIGIFAQDRLGKKKHFGLRIKLANIGESLESLSLIDFLSSIRRSKTTSPTWQVPRIPRTHWWPPSCSSSPTSCRTPIWTMMLRKASKVLMLLHLFHFALIYLYFSSHLKFPFNVSKRHSTLTQLMDLYQRRSHFWKSIPRT